MAVNLLSDRELLELAAKAHGNIKLYNDFLRDMTRGGYEWNPLEDDGDALRLAVKLNMFVRCGEFSGVESPVTAESGGHDAAATRRAIVYAAAEIGGRMAI